MANCEIIEKYLKSLDPENMPPEYIYAVRFKGPDGNDVLLKGDDVNRFLKQDPSFEYQRDMDVEVFMNIPKLMKAIRLELEYIYYQIDQRFAEEAAEKNGPLDG